VANSGNEVPNATIVTPIIKGDTPRAKPTFSAFSTKTSLALIRKAKLTTKININVKSSIILKF